MVWFPVGSAISGDDWQSVGAIQSNVLRLSYDLINGVPPFTIFGQLREQYEDGLFNSRWYNLYPKIPASEVLALDGVLDFESTPYFVRNVQVRQSNYRGYSWGITIEQWL